MLEKISEKLAKANEHTAKSVEHVKKAKEHQKNIKLLTSVLLLFIMISLSAQSFEKINGLNKTSTEIKTMSQELQQIVVGYYPSGNLFTAYYDSDYGSIVYIFDKSNVCQYMEIYSHPNRKLEINKMIYDVKITNEKDRTIYFIKYR